MPTFKIAHNNEEFLDLERGGVGSIYIDRSPTALIYTPESSNFWRGDRNAFTYFLCLGDLSPVPLYKTQAGNDSRKKIDKYPVLGIAELQVNPSNDQEVWLKYVSVHGKHQGKGIGRELGRMIAEHMQGTNLHLRRSYASDLAISGGYQNYMDRILDEHGVAWSQSGRDLDYGM